MQFRNAVSTAIRVAVCLAVVAGAAALISATNEPYTAADKAFYADPNLVNFVRPGLRIQILSAEIAADGTVRTRYRLTDPRGLPLDRLGITTPGAVSVSLMIARIPRGQNQYLSYTTRVQTSPITRVAATQASADTGGTHTMVADGEYVYTFGTRLPAGYDRTVTHTIGAWSNRNLTEFDLGINLADTAFNFVPDGSRVTVTRDVIRTVTCNKCHQDMRFHGNTGRKSMETCVLCHTPQTTDPDTGNTVDMVEMTHKIHMGANLPSVKAGRPYQIIGNAQVVWDYSKIRFPPEPRNCIACHETGKGAAQERAWLTRPSRQACRGCHDDVNFATGAGHVNLPQPSDAQCAVCHTPQGELEFDASISGAHTIERFSRDLPGIVFELNSVADGSAGRRPTVTFTLRDKRGRPVLASEMDRLALIMAGPASDYSSYISEDARAARATADGRHTYTFTAAIPAGARGTYTIGIEGFRNFFLLAGTVKERSVRDAGENKVIHFSVDGSRVAPRRTVVSLAKCNACHFSLSLHGSNRNTIEQCVLCHNPTMTDTARRPADRRPAESIDMRLMSHRIHTGRALAFPYSLYGFGNVEHSYSDVNYPGFRQDCIGCHVNNSERLPLPANLLPVVDPRGPINPVGPITAACTGCHSQVYVASHALANTSSLGESCATCHGGNSQFSVPRVHAR